MRAVYFFSMFRKQFAIALAASIAIASGACSGNEADPASNLPPASSTLQTVELKGSSSITFGDIATLSAQADYIVIATAMGSNDPFVDPNQSSNPPPLSTVLMQTTTVLKGTLTPGETFTLLQTGVETDTQRFEWPREPLVQQSQTYLLFLVCGEGCSHFGPVSSEGRMTVVDDRVTTFTLEPDAVGLYLDGEPLAGVLAEIEGTRDGPKVTFPR